MSNGRDGEPLRLDVSRVKALKGLGVANPSQLRESAERNIQPGVSLDDLSHLAPVSWVPRFAVHFFAGAGGAGTNATAKIGPSPVPFLIEWIYNSGAGNLNVSERQGAPAGAAPFATETSVLNPARDIPDGAQNVILEVSSSATAAVDPDLRIEQNVIVPVDLIVPVGVVVYMSQNSGNTDLVADVMIQEFPGGQ